MKADLVRKGEPPLTSGHNFYIGNGLLGMIVDPLGAQSLPYAFIPEEAPWHGGDRKGSIFSMPELELPGGMDAGSIRWHHNANPSISSNDAWIEWTETCPQTTEHPNTPHCKNRYGRGQLLVRVGFLPLVGGRFALERISDYTQRYIPSEASVLTEFVYRSGRGMIKVGIRSSVLWCSPATAAFNMTLENLGAEAEDVCIAGELYAFLNGRKLEGTARCVDGGESGCGFMEYVIEDGMEGKMPFPPTLKIRLFSDEGLVARKDGAMKALRLEPGAKASAALYFGWFSEGLRSSVRSFDMSWEMLPGMNFDDVIKIHRERVGEFLARSRVELPDEDLQRVFDRSLMTIAGNVGGYYPPCVGSLTNSSYWGLGWGMDNLPLYDVLLRMGHIDRVRSVCDFFFESMIREGSPTVNYAFDINPISNRLCHSIGSYAWLLKRYADASGDRDYMRNTLYPYLAMAADFILAYGVERDGEVIFPTRREINGITYTETSYDEVVSHTDYAKERGYVYAEGDHLTDVVSGIRWILKEAVRNAEGLKSELGVDDETIDRWKHALERIRLAQNDRIYGMYPGDEIDKRQIHTCAVFHGVYPLGSEIDGKMVDTYFAIKGNEKFWWGFSYNQQFYGVLARLGLTDELDYMIYESPLKYTRALTKDGSMFTEGADETGSGYFLFTYGCVLSGLLEALIQDYDGWIRVFPALPKRWQDKKVGFKGLTAAGGLRIDAQREENGDVCINVNAICDTTVRIELPSVEVTFDGGRPETLSVTGGERVRGYGKVPVKRLTFPLGRGGSADIRIAGMTAAVRLE